jgi:Ca2+-binding RTX toxin-like protein
LCSLWGQEGDDYLEPLGGADDVNGGAGSGDRVDYQSATGPVSLSLNNQPDDGTAGEGDNVRNDVEGIRGGAFADTLTGNGLANVVWGRNGADTINPGAGSDTVDAGDGADSITTTDGEVDTVACGAGIDQPIADVSDQLASDCETGGAS